MPVAVGTPPYMGAAAFAKTLGVNARAISQAIECGRITQAVKWGRGWMITDTEKATAEWHANTRPKVKNVSHAPTNGERPSPETLAGATLREREARAKILELEYTRRKAALVPAHEVTLRWAAIIVATRTRMLGLPSRVKQQLPHLTASDLAVIERLTRESLEELSEGTNDEAQSA